MRFGLHGFPCLWRCPPPSAAGCGPAVADTTAAARRRPSSRSPAHPAAAGRRRRSAPPWRRATASCRRSRRTAMRLLRRRAGSSPSGPSRAARAARPRGGAGGGADHGLPAARYGAEVADGLTGPLATPTGSPALELAATRSWLLYARDLNSRGADPPSRRSTRSTCTRPGPTASPCSPVSTRVRRRAFGRELEPTSRTTARSGREGPARGRGRRRLGRRCRRPDDAPRRPRAAGRATARPAGRLRLRSRPRRGRESGLFDATPEAALQRFQVDTAW